VAVGKKMYGSLQYAKCQIKLRRKLYRYLVWKHEGVQYSFYLGKVKILAPLSSAGELRPAGAAVPRSGSQRGVRK